MVTDWPKRIAYTVEEAMFASGLSRRSLNRAMESGTLPSAFVMGRPRISPEALDRFMKGLPPDPATTPKMRTVAISGPAAQAEGRGRCLTSSRRLRNPRNLWP
jgi:hypothetical protein